MYQPDISFTGNSICLLTILTTAYTQRFRFVCSGYTWKSRKNVCCVVRVRGSCKTNVVFFMKRNEETRPWCQVFSNGAFRTFSMVVGEFDAKGTFGRFALGRIERDFRRKSNSRRLSVLVGTFSE